MLNLFMAVIIEAYEKHSEMMHYDKVTPLILDEFVWTWVQFDTEGTASISPEDFFKLLKVLGQPLGLRSGNISGKDLQEFSLQLKIPLKKGRIPFHQTIYELVKHTCLEHIPESSVKDELDKKFVKFLKEGGHEDGDDAAKDEAALARLAKQVGHWSLHVNNFSSDASLYGPLAAGTMYRGQQSQGRESQMRMDSRRCQQMTNMRSKGPSAIGSGLITRSTALASVHSPKTPLTSSSRAGEQGMSSLGLSSAFASPARRGGAANIPEPLVSMPREDQVAPYLPLSPRASEVDAIEGSVEVSRSPVSQQQQPTMSSRGKSPSGLGVEYNKAE